MSVLDPFSDEALKPFVDEREWEDMPRPAYQRTGISALALMAKTFPPIRYVVSGLIAEGLTVLAGAPKARKSWMMLDIANAVPTGGYALGTSACEQGDVLFLALEDIRPPAREWFLRDHQGIER